MKFKIPDIFKTIIDAKKVYEARKDLACNAEECKDDSFKNVVAIGVWDRLHKGHIKSIETAFRVGEKTTIAIVREALGMNASRNREATLPYEKRKAVLLNFLKDKKYDLLELENDDEALNLFGKWAEEKKFDGCVLGKKDISHIGSVKRITQVRELLEKSNVVIPKVILVEPIKDEKGRAYSSSKLRAQIKQGKIEDKDYYYGTI